MILYLLSNLGMGGGGAGTPVVSHVDPNIGSLVADAAAGLAVVDPNIGSLIAAADASPLAEVDPEIGSLIVA